MYEGDTIAAIATGMGEAGVGVIRISGPDALLVGDRAFRPRRGPAISARPSHTVTYGWIVDGEGNPVDEALAIVMKGPRSFTGEHVVELHSHGGQVALRKALQAALQAGARLAEPGEFTRRAFLNGRMDLTQAEAVIDVIRAKTDRAMEAAVQQLRGELSAVVRSIRDRLLELTAHLEADIDFPELNLEVQALNEVQSGCRWCLDQMETLLRSARQGRLLRDGFRVVLAGRPNVGKSSLLNRLVKENRAIVTDVPGTTRDVIEEWVNLGGLPVLLADTAGIRETLDLVERMGVDRSRSMLERADLVIVVLDVEDGVTAEDRALIALLPSNTDRIGVMNKVDIHPQFDRMAAEDALQGRRLIAVSAASGEGIEDLEAAIAQAAGLADKEESLVANERHEQALRRATEHLIAAVNTVEAGLGTDMVSIDIRAAWLVLGEITGESVGEDLLDQIFSRFCIGK